MTTEEDIAMETEVHKVVNKCREEGLIVSLHCEKDRPHYGKFGRMIGAFMWQTAERCQGMRSYPVCTQQRSKGNTRQTVLGMNLVDKDRRRKCYTYRVDYHAI